MEYGPNLDTTVGAPARALFASRSIRLGTVAALLALAGAAHAQDKKAPPPTPPTAVPQPGAPKGAPASPSVTPAGGTRPGVPTPITSPATGAPGAAPAAADRPALPDIITDDPNMISLAAFSGPVDLSALIELLARTLDINVTLIGDVQGQVVFNAPKAIPKDRFLSFVDALLHQQGYTITFDPSTQFYLVQQLAQVGSELEGERPTTRVITTPNVRPSALQTAIAAQLGSGVPGQPTGQHLSFIDELGIIIATDTVRKLDQLEALVKRVLAEHAKSTWIRVELSHVAAPVARERALQLVGQSTGGGRSFGDPNNVQIQQQQLNLAAGGRSGQTFDNLGDRLTVDPQGNALIFRGLPEEVEQVQTVLAIIDKPSLLLPKRYNVGGAARQVADIARQRGLGEVTTIQSDSQDVQGGQAQFQNQQLQNQLGGQFGRQNQTLSGGSTMVVDESRGTILYYGTEDQQRQLERLVEELDIQSEALVIRTYKLVNSDAEKMADLLNGLIRNETPAASNPLLGEGGTPAFGGANPFTNSRGRQQGRAGQQGNQAAANPDDLTITGNAFVIANKALNQIIVKCPAKQQPEFAKLIEKLDLRRPQVYIEAKIVVVNWTDDLRLAFETQLVNASGKGGVLNTNFGLGSFGDNGVITSAKTVATGLGGFTAALINSNYVPIIMTALQREVDGRILASPQLLVDDNEEAELASIDQQPTQTTVQNQGNNQLTGFGGYQDAGTTLKVKPQISDGGYLRLKYEAELSNFTGAGSAGQPPPRQVNNLKSESITVPSDMTIILGGLTLDQKGRTQVKIPLIGDIPIIGQLFKDDNKNDRKTTLYIFLTPRIMRDPNFLDLRLKSQGPRNKSALPDDFPALAPNMIDSAFAPETILPPMPQGQPTPTAQPAPVKELDPRVPPPPTPSDSAPPPATPPATPPTTPPTEPPPSVPLPTEPQAESPKSPAPTPQPGGGR